MRIYLAVASVSCALLITEVTLTRIFSVTLMYHFAFLVLSIALFGLGSGAIVHFVTDFFRRRAEAFLGWIVLLAAVSLPLCLDVVLRLPVSPYLWTWINVARLIGTVCVCIVPFFFCGLFLSLFYTHRQELVSRLYSWDVLGAALGASCSLLLIQWIDAIRVIWIAGCLLLAAALLIAPRRRSASLFVSVGGILLVFVLGWTGDWLRLHYVKGQKEPVLEFSKWNAFSRVSVLDAGDRKIVQIDADASTEILSGDRHTAEAGEKLLSAITGLVYRLRSNGRALIMGAGGGRDILTARLAGHSAVGVEINPIIVSDLLLDRYHDYSGKLISQPGVEVFVDEARSFLERTDGQFDVIQGNAVDTWAATSGGSLTLSESYLYTVEAFELYFHRLREDGILTLGRWSFDPPQQTLRLAALAMEAMKRRGIPHPQDKIFLISDPSFTQGEGTPAVIFVKKLPFSQQELALLRTAAAENGYRSLYGPARQETTPFYQLIQADDSQNFFDEYPLNVRPPTDDQPFFFFTLNWSDLWSVWKTPEEVRKSNAGLFILLVTFVVLCVLTSVCFLLPMVVSRQKRRVRLGDGLFFLSIGIAFMMMETALIQRSIQFVGHPSYAFPTVVCALLLGCAWGSWRSSRVSRDRISKVLSRSALLAAGCVFVGVWVFPLWLEIGFGWSLWVRFLWLAIPVLGLGTVLGRLLPLGIKSIRRDEVPWAWALNGVGSVLGTVVAVLIAIQMGFSAVFWCSIGLYLLTGSSLRPGISNSKIQDTRYH